MRVRRASWRSRLRDADVLEQAVAAIDDVRLVVIDPIGSFLGGRCDSHRDNEVRGVLAPIVKIAEEHGPAILVVAHRRKSVGGVADDTALGSRAFTGVARSVWHLSRDPQQHDRRLLLPGKSNLSAAGTGLAFTIAGSPGSVHWERDPVTLTADEALAAEHRSTTPASTPTATDEAADWLREILSPGRWGRRKLKRPRKKRGLR